jgi:hypothetical protein
MKKTPVKVYISSIARHSQRVSLSSRKSQSIPLKEKSSHSKDEKKNDLKEISDGESTKKISSPKISIPSAKNSQEVVTKPK